jgi:Family of unknown function (DUF5996)
MHLSMPSPLEVAVSAKLSSPDLWPTLPYYEIAPTVEYLHRVAQIGGKYTLDQPFQPAWGNIALSVTPKGFSTPAMWAGDVMFVVDYDLLESRVTITASTGDVSVPLAAGSVADFYAKFVAAVAPLGIPAPRTTIATEIPGALHLDVDREVRPYDPAVARRVWAAFASVARSLNEYQSSYRGPHLPVGIMWGGFDLYAPRYNGRGVDPPSTAPVFQQNGMCAEVVAVGFYFGDSRAPMPSFFAYISPPPQGIATAKFGVDGAAFNAAAGLIVLPWETVRASKDPHGTVLTFADAVYENAVKLGGWPADLVGPRCDGWYASTHRVPAD